MKRWMICLCVLALLPCAACGQPISEEGYAADGSLAWRATCFANALPPLLQGVVEESVISGASVELFAEETSLALLTTQDGRLLAFCTQGGQPWNQVELTEYASGSVGLHDRAGTHPVFCVFQPYRSGQPTCHVDYQNGSFVITAYTPEEHQALTLGVD